MNELTQRGITALRSGDRTAARSLLIGAIKQDRNDVTAWLWLSGALDDETERIQCLQQVLRIDPGNMAAARGLAQILEQRTQPASQAAGSEQAAPAGTGSMGSLQEAPAQPVNGGERSVKIPAGVEEAAAPAAAAPEAATPAAAAQVPAMQEPEAAPAPVDTGPAETAVDASLETEGLASTALEAAPELLAPEAAGLAAVEVVARAPESAASARRRKRSRASLEGAQVIFRTRPSLVPALIGFWVFLLGAFAAGYLLRANSLLALIVGIVMGVALELIVAYAVIRNLSVRYELTNQQLTLRFRGKRTRLPVSDIFHVEVKQTFFQRLLGTGDVLMDAAVNDELNRLRMRNIPDCQRRLKQIKEAIEES